ncbi:hypothetical protein HPB51_028196 [Rhipicephalus microplus]|uniref:Ionotropic glutamate receptor L-glutamate and glycine-binding domain-containing protein n=1 Tax=Rhipicephalus microplus TaxID=6941 RepID=A0A9J6CXN2_RHIMP|nr:hypothetical protein HPB51_028196 [Rhipicephalus microplus]
MIMRHAMVENAGNFDYMGFSNVNPNLSTQGYSISGSIGNAAAAAMIRSRDMRAPPYSQAGYRDGKLYVDGVFGLVLEALADFVPLGNYDIVYDQRLSFGVRLLNGTYTGIIGLIQSGAADLAAAPVLVRYDRTEVATYAPVLFTSHCVLIAVAGEPGVNAFSYLFVFDWEASQMRLSALV